MSAAQSPVVARFGRFTLFAQPSASRATRIAVELVELHGVRCPRWATTGDWVYDGEVDAFWLVEEEDLVPLQGTHHCYVDLAVEYPATIKPPPAGKLFELEDASEILNIVLIDY